MRSGGVYDLQRNQMPDAKGDDKAGELPSLFAAVQEQLGVAAATGSGGPAGCCVDKGDRVPSAN